MVSTDANVATAPVAETPKKVKRGIGSARGTQRLRFSHEHANSNGLFYAHLDSVTVNMINIGESSTGMPSFNGCSIPRIAFTFASNESDVNARKYQTLSFNAVESNVNTIMGGKEEWKVNVVFDWIKHILNVFYLKNRELTPEEEAMLSLSFDDTDENGEYVQVAVEDVIQGWTTFFENVANLMNTGRDGQPVYKTKDNQNINVWIKLIRYIKNKNEWKAINNGELAFPTFVGEGCIEIYKQNTAPTIRIDAIKECITPKEINKKTPNIPGVGGMPAGGGVPITDPMMYNGSSAMIGAEAGADMPF